MKCNTVVIKKNVKLCLVISCKKKKGVLYNTEEVHYIILSWHNKSKHLEIYKQG